MSKGHQDFVTVVSDIDRGELIDVIDSHLQEEIIETIMRQPIEVRKNVKEVSVDMWGGFPKVIQEVFPNAQIVFDRFQVMKGVNKELNKIRRECGVDVNKNRFIILRNGISLIDDEKVKLEYVLGQSKQLRQAYELKEEFRDIYERCNNVDQGNDEITAWLKKAQSIYCTATKTFCNHLDGICNYFLNRTTSGVMEGVNNRPKLIKRQAYEFVNFENFRDRLLASFAN